VSSQYLGAVIPNLNNPARILYMSRRVALDEHQIRTHAWLDSSTAVAFEEDIGWQ
jgi:hypothetical protein